MNELVTNIHGKFPYVLDDIRFLDAAYRMGFEALARATSFNRNCILYGCVVTPRSGLNEIYVSDGAVLIRGEILYFSAKEIRVNPGYKAVIVRDESWDSKGRKVFGDGTVHNTYKKIKGVLTLVRINASGDFIDLMTAPRLSDINDFDGLIHKGKLTSSDNLNDIVKNGLYVIQGSSLPLNFPDETLLGEQISSSSNFWLKTMYVGRDDKYYQELGFKRGLLARRYLRNGTAGWSAWFNFWASNEDTLDGTKKCSVVSPYTLQKHQAWQTPAYLGSFASGSIKELFYRKLTDGRVEVRGRAKCQPHYTSTEVIQLPEGYRPNIELRYFISNGGSGTYVTISTDGKFTSNSELHDTFINIVFSIE